MATPEATDVIYMRQPAWPVAHHLSAAGVPSPSKTAYLQRLSKHHRITLIAASIAIGLVLAAICFIYMRIQQTIHALRDTAKPWAAAVVEARQREAAPAPSAVPATPSEQVHANTSLKTTVQSTENDTSVTINGRPVPIPSDGTIHQTYTDGTTQGSVTIKVNRSSAP